MGSSLDTLRKQLDEVNLEILELINRRAEIVQQIGQIKSKQSMKKI